MRAKEPAKAPPDFAPPKVLEGRRTAGHVQVPEEDGNDAAGPLEMSWKVASAGALTEASPTKLRRTSSIAGNVLVAENTDGSKKAMWLQRKLAEESHLHNYVRIGFPLQPFVIEGAGECAGSWQVTRAEEGSMYPFEMVAIKVQASKYVFPDEEVDDGDLSSSEQDGEVRLKRSRNAANEISALQMVREFDPEGKGNVIGADLVVHDEVSVYVCMPYCKEGTMPDYIGANGINGRLEEPVAKKFFASLLNGLSTLQKIKLCHRNLSLEKLLVRGDECYISSLGWALRVPTSEDGTEIHLIEPQSACGKKPEYIAPEVFRSEPFDGFAVDLWASAVILYLMLFGSDMLFAAPIPEDPKFQEICVNGHLKAVVDKFQALATDVKPVSEQAISLLQSMLRADPAERLTLAEVLEHPWMKA